MRGKRESKRVREEIQGETQKYKSFARHPAFQLCWPTRGSQPHVDVKSFKGGRSTLTCHASVKYTLDFQDLTHTHTKRMLKYAIKKSFTCYNDTSKLG